MHYSGLKNIKEVELFSGSIEESYVFLEALVYEKQYEKIHIVGHRWGGGACRFELFRKVWKKRGKGHRCLAKKGKIIC